MNRKKDIPQEVIDLYSPRYQSGELSCNDVSKATGFSRFKWTTVFVRLGIHKEVGVSRWTDAHTQQAIKLYQTMNLKDTAKALGFSTTYTREMLVMHGIERRPAHRRMSGRPPKNPLLKPFGNSSEWLRQPMRVSL